MTGVCCPVVYIVNKENIVKGRVSFFMYLAMVGFALTLYNSRQDTHTHTRFIECILTHKAEEH